eukprot:Rmarinus@m.9834
MCLKKFAPSRIVSMFVPSLSVFGIRMVSRGAEEAFLAIKVALTRAPVLAMPDYSKPFIVTTDASQYAVGAVLSQVVTDSYGNKSERPIAHEARVLSTAEQNYGISPVRVKQRNKERREKPVGFACMELTEEEARKGAYEREGLAVMFALRTFGMYLRARPFVLRTDQQALTHLFNQSKPSDRVQGWLNTMSQYNFEFELQYIKGKDNIVADALSRRPDLMTVRTAIRSLRLNTSMPGFTREDVRKEQLATPEYRKVVSALRLTAPVLTKAQIAAREKHR